MKLGLERLLSLDLHGVVQARGEGYDLRTTLDRQIHEAAENKTFFLVGHRLVSWWR